MLDHKKRYLQIAFNSNIAEVRRILPSIPEDEHILIEAGTPFIKKEGVRGVSAITALWDGEIVMDIKTSDGGIQEVMMAQSVGATAVTCLGSAPIETIDLFISACKKLGIHSMVDMLGVEDPLRVLMQLSQPPTVVVLHKGRDEESNKQKVIKYMHIKRIRSKFDVLISAAGGVDLREASSAIFNGANIVVANIVPEDKPWTGIRADDDIGDVAQKFLRTIG